MASAGNRRAQQWAAARELREQLLAELAQGPRSMRTLVATLGMERELLHRSLLVLRDAGKTVSSTDRRRGDDGLVIGATWMLVGDSLPARTPVESDGMPRRRVRKGPWPAPPRDPFLWALYGVQPEARAAG